MAKTRSNEEWLRELESSGEEQAVAIADLRAYLLRAARYAFSQHPGRHAYLGPGEIEQLAEDCAQDALLAILKQLRSFRGDSRFTTWAYKFVINLAMVAARRERWKHVSLDQPLEDSDLPEWPLEDARPTVDPDRMALRAEVWAVIRAVIERDLTDRQRQVLKAIVFDERPMDEVVQRLDSNRNAIYKLLHDARSRLKAQLEAQGFGVQGIFDTFGTGT